MESPKCVKIIKRENAQKSYTRACLKDVIGGIPRMPIHTKNGCWGKRSGERVLNKRDGDGDGTFGVRRRSSLGHLFAGACRGIITRQFLGRLGHQLIMLYCYNSNAIMRKRCVENLIQFNVILIFIT